MVSNFGSEVVRWDIDSAVNIDRMSRFGCFEVWWGSWCWCSGLTTWDIMCRWIFVHSLRLQTLTIFSLVLLLLNVLEIMWLLHYLWKLHSLLDGWRSNLLFNRLWFCKDNIFFLNLEEYTSFLHLSVNEKF